MTLEFSCPWCGCECRVRGAEAACWRFRVPCELCDREIVVTWDGRLVVSRAAKPLARADEDTVRIRLAKVG